MSTNLLVEQLPAPQRCGLCGRPTTRYSPELGIAFCGREQRPADGAGSTGDFALAMRGGDTRRGLLRLGRSRTGVAPRSPRKAPK